MEIILINSVVRRKQLTEQKIGLHRNAPSFILHSPEWELKSWKSLRFSGVISMMYQYSLPIAAANKTKLNTPQMPAAITCEPKVILVLNGWLVKLILIRCPSANHKESRFTHVVWDAHIRVKITNLTIMNLIAPKDTAWLVIQKLPFSLQLKLIGKKQGWGTAPSEPGDCSGVNYSWLAGAYLYSGHTHELSLRTKWRDHTAKVGTRIMIKYKDIFEWL